MGIRGLTSIINRKAPEATKHVDDIEFIGKKFAIDSSILLYKFSHAAKTHGNAHIIGFLNKVIGLLGCGILPVFVFDGVPPEEKLNTLQKRKDDKRKLYAKVEALEALLPAMTSPEELTECKKKIKQLQNQIVKVTPEQKKDVSRLLQLLGVPTVESPGEAEHTCAFLQRSGKCDYCVTDDSDAFPFGAKFVIRLTVPKHSKRGMREVVSLDEILARLGMSYESFVDMCILSGCDFCDTIPRIGPIGAFKLICKHKSLERFVESDDYSKSHSFNFERAREIFTAGHPEVKELKLSVPDTESLGDFLKEAGFKPSDIRKWSKKLDSSRTAFLSTIGRIKI